MKTIEKTSLIEEARDRLHGWSYFTRAAWIYVGEIAEKLPDEIPADLTPAELNARLLGGARNWHQASFSGCYLVYNTELARRLLPPSIRARNPEGTRLLGLQADALGTAASAIIKAYKTMRGGH